MSDEARDDLANVILASRALVGIRGASRRAAVVVDAADELPDRDNLVRDLVAVLTSAGFLPSIVRLDDVSAFVNVEVIVVGGGNPFHLLARLRETGADARIAAAVRHGATYVGISAGAIVAGPSLEPQLLVSPFAAPDGLDLRGLGLVGVVIFPHRDRPGRADRIARAIEQFGHVYTLHPLADDELLHLRSAASLGQSAPRSGG